MKHLIATLAICVAANATQSSEEVLTSLSPNNSPNTAQQFQPDFSNITIDHARTYVEMIYPFAVKIQKEHRIPAPITIAIACLESGYGRSHYAQKRNNHLGIRGYKNGKAGYRKFKTTEACFDYFSNMLLLERYLPLQEIEDGDLFTWIDTLAKCGFNHRGHYSKKVMRMIRFIDLDKIGVPPMA